MEANKHREVKDRRKSLPEWQKPSVKELDINAITLAGFVGEVADSLFYS